MAERLDSIATVLTIMACGVIVVIGTLQLVLFAVHRKDRQQGTNTGASAAQFGPMGSARSGTPGIEVVDLQLSLPTLALRSHFQPA